MKPKFQPAPRRISAIQKCQRLVPARATVVSRLMLGKLTLRNVPLLIGEVHTFDYWGFRDEPAIVIGIDILKKFQSVAIDSKRGEIRFTSKCNVWAVAIDDVDQLKGVYPGEQVSVVEADNDDLEWVTNPTVRDAHRAHHAMHAEICPSADEGGTAG